VGGLLLRGRAGDEWGECRSGPQLLGERIEADRLPARALTDRGEVAFMLLRLEPREHGRHQQIRRDSRAPNARDYLRGGVLARQPLEGAAQSLDSLRPVAPDLLEFRFDERLELALDLAELGFARGALQARQAIARVLEESLARSHLAGRSRISGLAGVELLHTLFEPPVLTD